MTTTPDQPDSVPAVMAEVPKRTNRLRGSKSGMLGIGFLFLMFALCIGTLPWTLGSAPGTDVPRYDAGDPKSGRLPPSWWPYDEQDIERSNAAVGAEVYELIADEHGIGVQEVRDATTGSVAKAVSVNWPRYFLGSDLLGRSLGVRLLAGGGVSLGIGIAAAMISVGIGTIYGAIAAYMGGAVDSAMMRVVDVLYGLPYILLVVLLAVASNAKVDEYISRSKVKENWIQKQTVQMLELADGDNVSRRDAREYLAKNEDYREGLFIQATTRYPSREISKPMRTFLDVAILLVAIGGVSWLTMARVIRGQVLSLKNQQFVEAARAVGASGRRVFVRHLLPNLIGPIVVYATLAVPQAILQESFLSFLGIGVKPPLPSWGNLAAEGLSELNTYRSHWWLLFFPCLLLGMTLLAMNFVGEGLREAFDPKRSR
ncbi:MAG: ABC transporter permease [Phycisphaerales bacterium]|nr:ABC transporter permease [Phycisphaerales bacterium]